MSSATNGLGRGPVTIVACVLAPRDRDVEETPFLLHVVGQAVRVLLAVDEVHDHVRPLLALHAMDGRQQHPVGGSSHRQLRSQPRLERRDVVVQCRELADRHEVVTLGRTVHAPTMRVERGDRAGQADLVDQVDDHVGGGGAAGDHLLQRLDVGRRTRRADRCHVRC